MSCYHPLPAYKKAGSTYIGDYRLQTDATPTKLPCGGCLGCRTDRARAWALRCTLELDRHKKAVFSTLTYSDEYLPDTLQKEDLQRYIKRLRKRLHTIRLRYFASGEYGENTQRPHYHAILYGPGEEDADVIEETWGKGHVRTGTVTPQSIAYVAGYTQKKIGYKLDPVEYTNIETGEIITWEPPFTVMSRGGRNTNGSGLGGIGSNAKKYIQSWRSSAMLNGTQMPVPRYLHDAWVQQATPLEIEALEYERAELALKRDNSKARTEAKEKIAIAQQKIRAAKRTY